ncbi:MAG: DUF3024 domain-containing protein [Desulfuromonadales bacterium]|nr:DUF3024 domain-containing protein [Desulfuromonadales bacterium]
MALSEIELKRIDKIVGGFCQQKTPQHCRDQLRFDYRVDDHDVLLLEIRPRWNNPQEKTEMDVAKLKFNRTKNIWTLYWKRANGKWQTYQEAGQKTSLDELINEIAEDRYGCFFG